MKKRSYIYLLIPIIILWGYYYLNYKINKELLLTFISALGYAILDIELYYEKIHENKGYKWMVLIGYGMIIFILIVTIVFLITVGVIV
ncbi:MAG: hypothetical protein ACQEQF_09555 [Bacillota bacterium]